MIDGCAAAPDLGGVLRPDPRPAPDFSPLGADRLGVSGPHGHRDTRQESCPVACPPNLGLATCLEEGLEVTEGALTAFEDPNCGKAALEQEVGTDHVNATTTHFDINGCAAAPTLGVVLRPDPWLAPGFSPSGADCRVVSGPHGHPQTRQEGEGVACPPILGANPGLAVGDDYIDFAAEGGGVHHHLPPVSPGAVVEHFTLYRGGIEVADVGAPDCEALSSPLGGMRASRSGLAQPSGVRSFGLASVCPPQPHLTGSPVWRPPASHPPSGPVLREGGFGHPPPGGGALDLSPVGGGSGFGHFPPIAPAAARAFTVECLCARAARGIGASEVEADCSLRSS